MATFQSINDNRRIHFWIFQWLFQVWMIFEKKCIDFLMLKSLDLKGIKRLIRRRRLSLFVLEFIQENQILVLQLKESWNFYLEIQKKHNYYEKLLCLKLCQCWIQMVSSMDITEHLYLVLTWTDDGNHQIDTYIPQYFIPNKWSKRFTWKEKLFSS